MEKERVLELANKHLVYQIETPHCSGVFEFAAAIERETLERAAGKMTQWTGKELLEQWAQEVKP